MKENYNNGVNCQNISRNTVGASRPWSFSLTVLKRRTLEYINTIKKATFHVVGTLEVLNPYKGAFTQPGAPAKTTNSLSRRFFPIFRPPQCLTV